MDKLPNLPPSVPSTTPPTPTVSTATATTETSTAGISTTNSGSNRPRPTHLPIVTSMAQSQQFASAASQTIPTSPLSPVNIYPSISIRFPANSNVAGRMEVRTRSMLALLRADASETTGATSSLSATAAQQAASSSPTRRNSPTLDSPPASSAAEAIGSSSAFPVSPTVPSCSLATDSIEPAKSPTKEDSSTRSAAPSTMPPSTLNPDEERYMRHTVSSLAKVRSKASPPQDQSQTNSQEKIKNA